MFLALAWKTHPSLFSFLSFSYFLLEGGLYPFIYIHTKQGLKQVSIQKLCG